MPKSFRAPTWFFSPQEDDIWKSQWPGTVHQRIWTRAWCQKIKRFALLFLCVSVNLCRAALFPAGVKIGKVFDSFQICFKPNRDAVRGLACNEAKPISGPVSYPNSAFLVQLDSGEHEQPVGVGAVDGTWQGWKRQQLSWWSNLQSFGLEMKKNCSSPHASHRGWDLLLVLLFSSGKGSVSKWLQAVPCLSCHSSMSFLQSKPFRRVAAISFVPSLLT